MTLDKFTKIHRTPKCFQNCRNQKARARPPDAALSDMFAIK